MSHVTHPVAWRARPPGARGAAGAEACHMRKGLKGAACEAGTLDEHEPDTQGAGMGQSWMQA